MSTRAMVIRTAGDPDFSQAMADAVVARELRETRAELERTRSELKRTAAELEGFKLINSQRNANHFRDLTKKLNGIGHGIGYKAGEYVALVVISIKLVAGLFGFGEMREYFK